MYTYTTTEDLVYHMEPDLYQPGNILFADGHSLKTSNASITAVVAGSATDKGYEENIGKDARFHAITGFYQIRRDVVIATSWGTHCLISVNRSTQQTSTYAGLCNTHGDVTGDRPLARFANPLSILSNPVGPWQLFITDNGNSAIKTIDTRTGWVELLVQSDLIYAPRAMAYNSKRNSLYITAAYSAVFNLDLSTNELTLLAGEPNVGGLVDGSFSTTRFSLAREITMLGTGVYATVGQNTNALRIIDVRREHVSTICIANREDNPSSTCFQLNSPRSLLVYNDTLFIGEKSAIQAIPGRNFPVALHEITAYTQSSLQVFLFFLRYSIVSNIASMLPDVMECHRDLHLGNQLLNYYTYMFTLQ